jgi:hypothetical protein
MSAYIVMGRCGLRQTAFCANQVGFAELVLREALTARPKPVAPKH